MVCMILADSNKTEYKKIRCATTGKGMHTARPEAVMAHLISDIAYRYFSEIIINTERDIAAVEV